MPGAVLLVKTPRSQFLNSVGEADVRRHLAMRPNHVFQIASVTKSFVGVVAAQMHAEGTLNLDASITNWLSSDITAHFKYAQRMTLRHLLEHTSGLPEPRHDFWYPLQRSFLNPRGQWSTMTELRYAFDRRPAFAPGEGWAYCNTGYLLAGLIIDQVAGHHHSIEIRNRILDPLRLTNTFYELAEPPRGERAHGYERHFRWWRIDTTDWTPAAGGHAGLSSTVSDLARFVRALARSDGFLSGSARQELFADWADQTRTYFLGVQRVRSGTHGSWFIGHTGGTPGYHCFAFHQPKRDVTIVYFGSSTFMSAGRQTSRLNEFTMTLRDALLELALRETEPAESTPGREPLGIVMG
jgi:D-alanyl-D-alanine carboxypeptidase